MVIFRRAGGEQARGVLDQIRAQVAARDTADLPRYTFSGGVAEFPVDGTEATDLLGKADERLYAAKHAGRDRIH